MVAFGRAIAAVVDDQATAAHAGWLASARRTASPPPEVSTARSPRTRHCLNACTRRRRTCTTACRGATRASRIRTTWRQRRGVHLGRAVPAAAEAADALLQAAARDRRAGDDGEHHRRDARQAVGLLPRHVAPALGRGAARDDGRGRLRGARASLARAGAHQLHLVARPQHAADTDRTARGALLHRAGADAEDRQALRVGGGRRGGHAAGADVPGLRLGRRGAARAHRPAVVRDRQAEPRRGAEVRRPLLVEGAHELGGVAGAGPDRARELV
jgi:hypothetical protein